MIYNIKSDFEISVTGERKTTTIFLVFFKINVHKIPPNCLKSRVYYFKFIAYAKHMQNTKQFFKD